MCKIVRIWLVAFLCWPVLAMADEPDANRFDIFEFQVDGSRLLPVARIERAVYPFLGESKSLDDVERARLALEKAYHDAGYLTVVVSIPVQKVADATVHLAVTEATVSRLRVTESRYFSLGEIKAAVVELSEGNVPQFSEVQEQLLEVNRSPDRRVSPVLRPGRETGTVEVDLKVEDQFPLHASAEVNNRSSDGTSPTRTSASLHWDNVADRLESIGLTLQSAPERPSDGQVLSFNYNLPLGQGRSLSAYAVHSDSDVAVVAGVDTIGAGDIYGVRYLIPLGGTPSFFQNVNLGVDYKDFKQSVNLVGGSGFNTPIHYLPFTVGWDGSWSEAGHEARVGLSFNFHVPGLVGTAQEFADKRYKGLASYSYLKGSFERKESIYSDWSLSARGSWQYSTQALISNEQFSIGGVDTVRGYHESAAAGDNALALTLEASTPNLVQDKDAWVSNVRLIAFADAAQVSVVDSLFADSIFNLAGYGVGLRMAGLHGLTLVLDLAQAQNSIGSTQAGDVRLHFRVAYDW